MTIRNKLIAMAVVVLLAIATMAGVTYYRGDNIITGLAETAGMDVVKSATSNIDSRFQKIEGLVATVAEAVRYSSTKLGVTDEEEIEEILVAFTKQAQGSGIGSFKLGIEATGKLSDGSGWKEPETYDARTRPWYKQAAAAGKFLRSVSGPDNGRNRAFREDRHL